MNRLVSGMLVSGAIAMAASGCGKPTPAGGGPPPGMAMPVTLARVVEESIDVKVELVASLKSRDSVRLISELDTTVIDIKVRSGQTVSKGDVLFVLDSVQTRARLVNAQAEATLAKLSHERSRGLLKSETISQQEFDQATANFSVQKSLVTLAQERQSKTVVRAPFSGMVGERLVSVGQFVRVGETLIDLISVKPLDIVADVPERYLSVLKRGQKVHFQTDGVLGETFVGKLWYISPAISLESRTVRIKAELANSKGRLKPGLFGRVSLVTEHRDKGLVIPESAISFSSRGKTVIAVDAEGLCGFTPVTVGTRFKGRVEIVSGLAVGDIVVAEGGQKLGPGSLVMAAAESAKYGVTPGPVAVAAEPVPGPAPVSETVPVDGGADGSD